MCKHLRVALLHVGTSLFATALPALGGELSLQSEFLIGYADDEIPLGSSVVACFSPTGEIVVLDRQVGEVRRYAADGAWIGNIGSLGEGPGQFRTPTSICTDEAGNIYVGGVSSWIEVFDGDGAPDHRIPLTTTRQVNSMVVDSDGWLYVQCFDIYSETTIQKYFVESGKHVASFGQSFAHRIGETVVDPRVELQLAIGRLALWDESVISLQFWPQEILFYSTNGEFVRSIDARRQEAGKYRPPAIDGAFITVTAPETWSRGIAVGHDGVAWCGFARRKGSSPTDAVTTVQVDAYDLRSGDRIATWDWSESSPYIHDIAGDLLLVSKLVDGIPVISGERVTQR